MNDEINLQMSPLCQVIRKGEHSVRLEIYSDGKTGWILEAVDTHNNSTVWDDQFETDQAALDEALKTIEEEGIESLIGKASNVVHL